MYFFANYDTIFLIEKRGKNMSSERARKPLWVKFLSFLIGLVFWIGVAFAGVWAFVYFRYDINLFTTYKQLRILNEEVDTTTLYPNQFADTDMASAMTTVNAQIADMITYSETDGYKVNTNIGGVVAGEIRLTDKQTGAIIDNILKNGENGASVKLGSFNLEIQLVQVQFSNVDKGSADVNVVLKMDLKPIKEKMTKFPLKLFKNRLPDSLYFSSTVRVVKGETPFAYTVESKSLSINNLNEKQTEQFLTVINMVLKVGKTQQLNEQIAKPLIDGMIGNEENKGLAYSLKNVGAKDYNFAIDGEQVYFVITIE